MVSPRGDAFLLLHPEIDGELSHDEDAERKEEDDDDDVHPQALVRSGQVRDGRVAKVNFRPLNISLHRFAKNEKYNNFNK